MSVTINQYTEVEVGEYNDKFQLLQGFTGKEGKFIPNKMTVKKKDGTDLTLPRNVELGDFESGKRVTRHLMAYFGIVEAKEDVPFLGGYMKNLPAVFIGESLFSWSMLTHLIYHGYNIKVVMCRQKGEDQDWEDLTMTAFYHHIPSYKAVNINNFALQIADYKPEIIYCLGFRQLISQEILNICPIIGYHPTMLPENRGHHPIIWALINKQTVTGSTFFLMNEGVDSGDILSQEQVKIEPEDTVSTLYNRIIDTAKTQILTLDLKNRRMQNHMKATYLRKRIKGEEDVWLEY